jgi:hypothetical protein
MYNDAISIQNDEKPYAKFLHTAFYVWYQYWDGVAKGGRLSPDDTGRAAVDLKAFTESNGRSALSIVFADEVSRLANSSVSLIDEDSSTDENTQLELANILRQLEEEHKAKESKTGEQPIQKNLEIAGSKSASGATTATAFAEAFVKLFSGFYTTAMPLNLVLSRLKTIYYDGWVDKEWWDFFVTKANAMSTENLNKAMISTPNIWAIMKTIGVKPNQMLEDLHKKHRFTFEYGHSYFTTSVKEMTQSMSRMELTPYNWAEKTSMQEKRIIPVTKPWGDLVDDDTKKMDEKKAEAAPKPNLNSSKVPEKKEEKEAPPRKEEKSEMKKPKPSSFDEPEVTVSDWKPTGDVATFTSKGTHLDITNVIPNERILDNAKKQPGGTYVLGYVSGAWELGRTVVEDEGELFARQKQEALLSYCMYNSNDYVINKNFESIDPTMNERWGGKPGSYDILYVFEKEIVEVKMDYILAEGLTQKKVNPGNDNVDTQVENNKKLQEAYFRINGAITNWIYNNNYTIYQLCDLFGKAQVFRTLKSQIRVKKNEERKEAIRQLLHFFPNGTEEESQKIDEMLNSKREKKPSNKQEQQKDPEAKVRRRRGLEKITKDHLTGLSSRMDVILTKDQKTIIKKWWEVEDNKSLFYRNFGAQYGVYQHPGDEKKISTCHYDTQKLQRTVKVLTKKVEKGTATSKEKNRLKLNERALAVNWAKDVRYFLFLEEATGDQGPRNAKAIMSFLKTKKLWKPEEGSAAWWLNMTNDEKFDEILKLIKKYNAAMNEATAANKAANLSIYMKFPNLQSWMENNKHILNNSVTEITELMDDAKFKKVMDETALLAGAMYPEWRNKFGAKKKKILWLNASTAFAVIRNNTGRDQISNSFVTIQSLMRKQQASGWGAEFFK